MNQADLSDQEFRRAAYLVLRAERPDVRAADVWAFVNCDDGAVRNIDQFLCRHEWGDGEDPDTGREVAIYCNQCGACGDV